MIYSVFFGFLTLFSILEYFVNNKKRTYSLYILSIIALTLFAGLRDNIGYDFSNYKEIFDSIKFDGIFFNIKVEPFVAFLMYTSTFIGFNFFIFLFAAGSLNLKRIFIWKYSTFPILSLLLYFSRNFLLSDFGQIRQGVAMGIILFSLPYILNRKFRSFLYIIFLASMFHVSSILFIPAYFMNKMTLKRNVYILLVLLSIPFVFLDLKEVIGNVFSYILPSFITNKLDFYVNNYEKDKVIGVTFSMFLRFAIIVIALIFFYRKIVEKVLFRVIFNIYFIGFLFYIVFNSFPQIGIRASLFYSQFEILLIPLFIFYLKRNYINIFVYIIIIGYCVWGFYSTVFGENSYQFLPYKSILI